MKRLIPSIAFAFALLLLPGLAWAQQGAITGTVTEAETGNPLPGATVQVPDEGAGAATGSDGQYRITGVPAGQQTIRVTFVGYQAAERTLNVPADGTVRANFQLDAETGRLQEVVVTGLAQEQTRAESSVSVTSIDAGELTDDADFQSVEELFQGSTPGVTVSKSSGNIGAGIRFQVRGGVSLNSDGQPAIYVDGTRIDQSTTEGFGAGGQEVSPLADLNPDEIESIEVLKGPSAAALYGTDGADGVVLIETKSGNVDQDLRVSYSGTFGYQEKVRDYPSDRLKSAETANDIFRQGDIGEHQVSVTGSFGDATSYFASYSHRDSEGILPENSGKRNSVRANFEADPSDAFRISAETGFTTNDLARPPNDNNLFGQLSNTILAFGGDPFFFTDSTSVFLIEDQFRVQRLTGSLNASYSPSAISGFQLSLRAGSDVSSRRQNNQFPFSGTYTGTTDGSRSIFEERVRQYNGEASARYDYTLASDLSATSTVGTQLFTRSTENARLEADNFGTDAIRDIGSGADIQSVNENIFNRRSAGVFARQSFTLKDTYSLSASVRRDFSTKLEPGENTSFRAWYPSVQGNIRFAQFDAVPEFVSQLKLRSSFGQSGALPDPTEVQEIRLEGSASGYGTGAIIGSVGNPDLQAETITEYEGGIDLEFNNRYSLSTTYYFQGTSDSIVDFEPSPSTGLGAETRPVNVGRITGQGLETAVDLTLLRTDQHSISFSANHTWQTSEVQDIDGQELTGPFDRNVVREGLSPRAFYGYDVDGAEFTDSGAYAGVNVVDQNGDDEITDEDQVELGEVQPDQFGGGRLRARLFDDLTISGRVEYQVGRSVFNNSQVFAVQFQNDPRVDRRAAQLGIPGFPEPEEEVEELEPGTDEYREAANQFAETFGVANRDDLFASFVEEADFLKVREIAIAYDFAGLIDNLTGLSNPIRQFRVRLSGNNLFTFSPYSYPDPQVSSTGARGIAQNQDFLTLQQPRSFTTTVNIGF